jgi:hypothetical protein
LEDADGPLREAWVFAVAEALEVHLLQRQQQEQDGMQDSSEAISEAIPLLQQHSAAKPSAGSALPTAVQFKHVRQKQQQQQLKQSSGGIYSSSSTGIPRMFWDAEVLELLLQELKGWSFGDHSVKTLLKKLLKSVGYSGRSRMGWFSPGLDAAAGSLLKVLCLEACEANAREEEEITLYPLLVPDVVPELPSSSSCSSAADSAGFIMNATSMHPCYEFEGLVRSLAAAWICGPLMQAGQQQQEVVLEGAGGGDCDVVQRAVAEVDARFAQVTQCLSGSKVTTASAEAGGADAAAAFLATPTAGLVHVLLTKGPQGLFQLGPGLQDALGAYVRGSMAAAQGLLQWNNTLGRRVLEAEARAAKLRVQLKEGEGPGTPQGGSTSINISSGREVCDELTKVEKQIEELQRRIRVGNEILGWAFRQLSEAVREWVPRPLFYAQVATPQTTTPATAAAARQALSWRTLTRFEQVMQLADDKDLLLLSKGWREALTNLVLALKQPLGRSKKEKGWKEEEEGEEEEEEEGEEEEEEGPGFLASWVTTGGEAGDGSTSQQQQEGQEEEEELALVRLV